MIIAVDFDGCLCENKWPDIGKAHDEVILYLRYRQAHGDKIILWTCREGDMLRAAVMWCLNRGLRFDAINDNLPENIALYGNNCRKVWADEYWDDKSVLVVKDAVCYLNSNGKGRRSVCFFGKCRPPKGQKKRPWSLKWFRELREACEHGPAND